MPKELIHVKYMERERRVLVRAMIPGARPTKMAEWKADDGWGVVQSIFESYAGAKCTMEAFYARLRQ